MTLKKSIPFIILLLLSCIPLLDLLHSGLPITHDGQDHVARIANFYQSLTEGIWVPRWAENLNWGYGHPILMFLYPLPSYIASAFHFLGFSLVDSTKLVFGSMYIASGIAMYLFLKEFFRNSYASLIGALAYEIAPYRFVDLYVRGAIGEHVAFVFLPLTLLFLTRLYRKPSYLSFVSASFSLAFLILAHNAMSLMFIPLIALFTFYLFSLNRNKTILILFLEVLFFGFLLSAFFWLPAFFEGRYTLRDIVTKGTYIDSFSKVAEFLYGPWNFGGTGRFTVQVGIIQWIAVLSGVPIAYYLKKLRNPQWMIITGSLFIFLFTIFLMTSASNFIWEKITLLQKFQFTWRFLSVIVFITACLTTYLIIVLPKHFQKTATVIIILLLLFINKDYWHAKGYLYKPETFFTGIYNGTTDTGESAPIWSVRFMEKAPKAHMEVIGGNAKITEMKRTSTFHSYTITALTKVQLRENTLFFPGWKVFVDGRKVPVQFQDATNRGVMTFYVEKGIHAVTISFSETKLRFIADIVSIFAIFSLFILGILNKGKIKLWQLYQ